MTPGSVPDPDSVTSGRTGQSPWLLPVPVFVICSPWVLPALRGYDLNPPEPSTMAFLSKTFREGCSSVVCPEYLGPWVLVPLTHTNRLCYTQKCMFILVSSENPEKQRKSPIIPPPDDGVCGHSDIILSRWLSFCAFQTWLRSYYRYHLISCLQKQCSSSGAEGVRALVWHVRAPGSVPSPVNVSWQCHYCS